MGAFVDLVTRDADRELDARDESIDLIDSVAISVSESLPWMCRFGLHDTKYLPPSEKQAEEIRQLISFGRGNIAYVESLEKEVYDRVCARCFKAEPRITPFIEALKKARGL